MWPPAGWPAPACGTSAVRPCFMLFSGYVPSCLFASWAWTVTTAQSSSTDVARVLHQSGHHLHALAAVPQERHLSHRTEKLGGGTPAGWLRPTGMARPGRARADPRPG